MSLRKKNNQEKLVDGERGADQKKKKCYENFEKKRQDWAKDGGDEG